MILGDSLEQVERYVLADDGRALQKVLLLSGKAIDARSENRLDGGRHLDRLRRARELIGPARAAQRLRFRQRAMNFFWCWHHRDKRDSYAIDLAIGSEWQGRKFDKSLRDHV